MTPTNPTLPTAEQKREWRELVNKPFSYPWHAVDSFRTAVPALLAENEALIADYHETRAALREGLTDDENVAHPTTIAKIRFWQERVQKLEGELAAQRTLALKASEFITGLGYTGELSESAGKQAREQRDKLAGLLKRCLPFIRLDSALLHYEAQSALAELGKEQKG